jgi:cytoskeleton protein RodZ
VFEIGGSLRAAREQRHLELLEVSRATRIRAKYLGALEEERFDLLPGTVYAKGFLRTYADFLGLEGQRFVDEYNERFAPIEPPETQAALPIGIGRRRRLAGAPLAVVLFAVALGLLTWRLTESHDNQERAFAPLPVRSLPKQNALPASTPKPHRTTPIPIARISFVAARGPCWLSVRLGSETGRTIYERILESGQRARFVGKRLWIRLGAPWNIDAKLNGRRAVLPASIGNVLVASSGVRALGA